MQEVTLLAWQVACGVGVLLIPPPPPRQNGQDGSAEMGKSETELLGKGVTREQIVDLMLRRYPDGCPRCGSKALEALTWRNPESEVVTAGCYNCDWMSAPPPPPPSVAFVGRRAV